MANSYLAAGGIVLILMGLVAFFFPIENYLKIESKMTPQEICESLGILMPPRYNEFCNEARGIIENPSPYIVFASYAIMGSGVIVLIVVAVKGRKKVGKLRCKECGYWASSKENLADHLMSQHMENEK